MTFKLPTVNGYIHLGDGFVLLSGIILGPFLGGLTAGIGSMLADLLLGYAIFAPATFVIKALAALTAGICFHKCKKIFKNRKEQNIFCGILSGIPASIIVTSGYFIYETFLYTIGAAALGIYTNLLQNLAGVIIAVVLIPVLVKIPDVNNQINQNK
jgi:Predicted membrane protein